MDLVPKKKTDVQLTGFKQFDIKEWKIPYSSKVTTEFKDRYSKLVNDYNELMEEVNWNNIIYEIDIPFEPVIGKTYHLYKEEKYYLSLIAPHEWRKGKFFVGDFKLEHTGKWMKQENDEHLEKS